MRFNTLLNPAFAFIIDKQDNPLEYARNETERGSSGKQNRIYQLIWHPEHDKHQVPGNYINAHRFTWFICLQS
jgi:hypothetical protein